METLVDVFKALSDETRLRILNLLYERELCVCDVMEILQITQAKSIPASYLPQKCRVGQRSQAGTMGILFDAE